MQDLINRLKVFLDSNGPVETIVGDGTRGYQDDNSMKYKFKYLIGV